MKIAYLTPTYPPYPGGIGIAAAYLAREISRRGHMVSVFTPQYNGGAEATHLIDGVSISFLTPFFTYGNAAFLPQLRTLLKDFDIVHCYYPFFGGIEVAAYAKSRGAKFALVVHHEMDTYGEGLLKYFFKAHETYLMPWVLRTSQVFAALSHDYLDHSPFAAKLKKPHMPAVAIIPNGVDVDLFTPSVERVACHDVARLVLVAGLDRAHYFKGVPVLIGAVKLLKERGISVHATIVGDGDMKKGYEILVQNEHVADRVIFSGLVMQEKLPALLNEQDIFVMPSVAPTESFCIAAAEAQACGLPAIVSDLPGLRQTIGVGETGFVFPVGLVEGLADSVAKLIQDKDLYGRFSVAARARMVERFSWQEVAKKALTAYEQALGGRPNV